MEYRRIKCFTKVILDMMFYSGIIIVATVPIWLKLAGTYYASVIAKHYLLMLPVFLASGICGLLIVFELRKMMRTVLDQNCFVRGNVQSLKKMSVLSVGIAGFFIAKCIFMPTPATLIIILVFFVAALFSLVLSCVFKEAVDYKEENDLTI